jgi:hypothetical protein
VAEATPIRLSMARLVLINGAPGSGESTLADAVAPEVPMTLALDVDGIRHSLGRWGEDPVSSGLHARRLGLTLVRALLNPRASAGSNHLTSSRPLRRSSGIGAWGTWRSDALMIWTPRGSTAVMPR